MPTFRITGRGRKTNRRRSAVYRAIDQATALAMADASDIVAAESVRLPDPAPSAVQFQCARALGLKPPTDISRSDLLAAVLHRLTRRCRLAEIVYLATVDGQPWVA